MERVAEKFVPVYCVLLQTDLPVFIYIEKNVYNEEVWLCAK